MKISDTARHRVRLYFQDRKEGAAMTKINFWFRSGKWHANVYPANPGRTPKRYDDFADLETMLITIARDIEGWPQ